MSMTPATFKTRREIMGLSMRDVVEALATPDRPAPTIRTLRRWESPQERYPMPVWVEAWMTDTWNAWLSDLVMVVDGMHSEVDASGEDHQGFSFRRPVQATTEENSPLFARLAALTLLLEAEGVPVKLEYIPTVREDQD